jgi:class 3 adenylate cyclase/DNA-binding IscR family transcriptional regulator
MECGSCGAANRAGRRFCAECGARLTVMCPACQGSNEPGEKFCGDCGKLLSIAPAADTPPRGDRREDADPRSYTPKHLVDRILGSRSALEGERKVVTVLFADVKGSMELAEGLDPEEWHAILERFFQILTDGVHRFEGTVNQYTGDGIMALFGAPIAHEDHAQRACYAALHLRDALRAYADELRIGRALDFGFRMGLNSGEVVVGKIGDDLRMDYTAQGHTVGLAARMEQIAAPDRVYLSQHTADLVSGYFALRDLGETQVKGASAPLRVYELEGTGSLSTRFDVSRARGLSRFVGRSDEMTVLENALERAIAGTGQVVGVVAEAGTGKSRLCFEFLERCRARRILNYQAQGGPHGKAVPLQPALQLFRNVFGLTEGDSDRTARDKIAGRLVLLDPSLTDALPLLFDFLQIPDPERPAPPMEADMRNRLILDIVGRLTQARSAREPAVILLEDLHWIDEASEALLVAMVESIVRARTLVIVNTRPTYEVAWTNKSFYRQIPLLPLGREAIGELMQDLLGGDESLAALPALIEERTGGNPFFIEEVVRELADSGLLEGTKGCYRLARPITELPVPATVQGVLAARTDRLAERDKEVLQSAAVIGRSFSLDLLASIVDLPRQQTEQALDALVAGEFLFVESLYPSVEYGFAHSLTRDVAYESLLAERRRVLHAAIARSLAATTAEARIDELAALLAHHHEAADEPLEAARWHARAAAWIGLRDERECFRHWQRVRTMLAEVPETQETIGLGLAARNSMVLRGLRAGIADLGVAGLLDEARALAVRSDDPATELMVEAIVGSVSYYLGDLIEAGQLLDGTIARARAGNLPTVVSTALVPWLVATGFHGPVSKVIQLLDEIEVPDPEAARVVLGYDATAFVESMHAFTLVLAGRVPDALRVLERAEEAARAAADPNAVSVGAAMACWIDLVLGDVESAVRHGRRSVQEAERMGAAMIVSNAYACLSFALGSSERIDEAAAALQRLEQVAQPMHATLLPVLRALQHRSVGDSTGCCALLPEAIDELMRSGNRIFAIQAAMIRASILLDSDAEAFEEELRRTERLVEETEAWLFTPAIAVLRAELQRRRGDEAGWRAGLAGAQRAYEEMGATRLAAEMAAKLGGVE